MKNVLGQMRQLGAAAALALLTTQSLGAASGGRLLYDFSASNPPSATGALEGALSVHAARVNFGLLRSNQLTLDTGEGLVLDLVRSRDISHSNGAQVWEGRVEGYPDSSVVLGRYDQSLSGAIRFDGRLFKLVPLKGGLHVLAEFPPAEPVPEVPPLADSGASAAAAETGAAADGGPVVDVMVVYTPAAAAALSQQGGIESLIATAVAESNLAYVNSAINLQLNLVHAEQVSYTESTFSNDLSRLRGSSDGYMDAIHATRDAVGADMVALIRAGAYDACGIGYLNNSLSASYAFSVTYYSCATGYFSFAHELGHNKGSHHDPDTAGGSAALFSYSYGHRDPGNVFRTVMAYNCPNGGCTRYPYFSNPGVEFQSTGLATGVANVSDNAQSINYAASAAAAWRAAPVSSIPDSPSNASATATSEAQIDLAWIDNSDNETGFRIEQSSDNVAFSEIAITGANATGYSVTGLAADTTYWYRIYARNSLGDSSSYAAASATTDMPPAQVYRLAYTEATSRASVTGSYLDTRVDDNVAQVIAEAGSGGPKRRRHSLLEHRWTVDVAPGNRATLLFDFSSQVSGGEVITLDWSTDLASWQSIGVPIDADLAALWEIELSPQPSGPVHFRLMDSQRVDGLESNNSVSVDYLAVRTDNEPAQAIVGTPVLAAGSVGSATVDLSWTDVANETGYAVYRDGDPVTSLPTNTQAFQDVGLEANRLYSYYLLALNPEVNVASNTVSVTTAAAPPPAPLSLTVESFKDKGVKTVRLRWDSGHEVDIFRDGEPIAANVTVQPFEETLGKGGGTYVYRVCEAGTNTCSDPQSAVF